MRPPPEFTPEQIDYLEDFIFNRLTILSLQYRKLLKQTVIDHHRCRVEFDILREILRNRPKKE